MAIRENIIVLIGRVATELETSKIGELEISKTTFYLAVDRNEKNEDRQKADFFNIELYGSQAELAESFLKVGFLVEIKGEMRIDRVERYDTSIVYYAKVIASKFMSLTPKSSNEN